MLKSYLLKLLAGGDLSAQDMEKAFDLLTSGQAAHSQIGAFLALMQRKKVTSNELVGAARMLRRAATFIDCGRLEPVDVVGTGGDGANTFNISTASFFVAAGAGVVMAKHGNRSATSKCGAADVLEKLGLNLEAPPEVVENSIADVGAGFLFAAKMHPAIGRMRILRRELGIPTMFNLLGPLLNPAGAKYQLLGVNAPDLTELFAETLRQLGSRRAMVVHGMYDHLDEISCCGPTRVSELKDGQVRTYELLPEVLLGETYDAADLAGGDAELNAKLLLDVVCGCDRGAKRAVVLANAGAVIYIAGLAVDLRDGVRCAAESIDSGAAKAKLDAVIEASRG